MKVDVYGVDHSPWVQAVLMGLHDRGIEHSLRSDPPLAAFRRWGVLMPAASFDGGAWQIESSDILVKIGFAPVSDEDYRAIQHAWRGVHHRSDNPLRFFSAFARVAEPSGSWSERAFASFARSFTAFYMFTLLSLSRVTGKLRDPKDWAEQYLHWEHALEGSADDFIDGDVPGPRDLMLFGVIQCHASIPVPPLETLRTDDRLPRLRAWIAAMHERFTDYSHLYSGPWLAPGSPAPTPAAPSLRACFWIGLLSMIAALPLTLLLVAILARRVPRRGA
jgi:hypothetical protein